MRLKATDPMQIVFSFDDPVQRSAAGLVQMDENQRSVAWR
jgi:hypothetical protein